MRRIFTLRHAPLRRAQGLRHPKSTLAPENALFDWRGGMLYGELAGADIRFSAVEGAIRMERKKASEFPQELLNIFDKYVHGEIGRREFLDHAQKYAIGGLT